MKKRKRSARSIRLSRLVERWQRNELTMSQQEKFSEEIGRLIRFRVAQRFIRAADFRDVEQRTWERLLGTCLPGYGACNGAVSTMVFSVVDSVIYHHIAATEAHEHALEAIREDPSVLVG